MTAPEGFEGKLRVIPQTRECSARWRITFKQDDTTPGVNIIPSGRLLGIFMVEHTEENLLIFQHYKVKQNRLNTVEIAKDNKASLPTSYSQVSTRMIGNAF